MRTENNHIAIVYMVAGISSRFGGGIKQLAEVGLNGETLIEISLQQAMMAGFNEIIFIVGEKTEELFKSAFGTEYKGVPVLYAKQMFDPTHRDRPWGTVDALVSAKDVITSPFVVCNGDDLYGQKSLELARNTLLECQQPQECMTIGYKLGRVMPNEGAINRGIIELDEEGNVKGIAEFFGIEKAKLAEHGLTETHVCSMTLFGLKENVLELLDERLKEFKKQHQGDRKAECLLPVELGAIVGVKKIVMRCVPTDDVWMGITNPGDDEAIKNALVPEISQERLTL